MRPAIHKACAALEWCGIALLVLASFPLIALAAFVLRAFVAGAVAVAVVAVVALWFAYEPFRGWVFTHLHGPSATHL